MTGRKRKRHSLPIPRSSKRPQRSRSSHVEYHTCCTAVHDSIEIRVALIDEEGERDCAEGGGGEDVQVGHEVFVEAGEGGGGCY